MTKLKLRFMAIFAVFLMFIAVICGMGGKAYAATVGSSVIVNFDNTDVMDDLAGSTVDGKPFDLNEYNFDTSKSTQLFSVVEYCYSFYTDRQANYALYAYVYNPQGINFNVYSASNKIQLSTGNDENFYKYPLLFLSSSTTAGYEGLFIKFKVLLTDNECGRILSSLNSSERQYRVSGIELLTSGEWTAHDYNVSKAWIYKGYAVGYGSGDSDSLTCSEDTTRTLQLDVHHTYYRQPTIYEEYQTQIDTVYFAVPRSIFDKYEKLQKIKAEWYEYKTKEILVMENGITIDDDNDNRIYNFFDQMYALRGKYIGKYGATSRPYRFGWIDNAEASHDPSNRWGTKRAWNYNVSDFYKNVGIVDGASELNFDIVDTMYYFFETPAGVTIDSYDPYTTVVEQGGIESNVLYDYIKNYKDQNATGNDVKYLDCKDGRIRADLFEDDIDNYRKVSNDRGFIKKGYSCYDFDVDLDTMNLFNVPLTISDAEYFPFLSLFLGSSLKADLNLAPIYILKDNDIKGTTDSDRRNIANNLMINYNDVSRLQDFYKQSVTDDKVVVLFRFAVTDYHAFNVELTHGVVTVNDDRAVDGRAYIAQQEVFLDFDIIQLSFRDPDSEKDIVYGVVADPIDIIDDITPPTSMNGRPFAWLPFVVFELVVLFGIIIVAIIEFKKYKR